MRDLLVDFLTITHSFEFTANGDEQLYGQTLFFPEVTSFGNDAAAISKAQEKIVQEILEHEDAEEFQRRFLPEGEIEQATVTVELVSPARSATWREPLSLQFAYLFWEHQQAKVGFVPGLGIEVVASDPKKFDEMLEDHIRFALNRRGVQQSLFDLALLQRSPEITVSKVNWNAYPLTPKERYEREENEGGRNKSVLGDVAKRLDVLKMPVAVERDESIKQLAWMLAGRRATSVLLVGESGVGKTAIVQHLAEKAADFEMGKTPIFQTSGSRIVAGMTGFGEWQERCRQIVEEAKDRKALMFFGNLFELMQVGQSSASSESLGSFFRPYLIRGEFLAVAECTPEQLALIEQIDPRMLDAFRQLKVGPSTDEETLVILKVRHPKVTFKKGMLERLVTLHKRYSGYSAFPGKAVRFLDRIVEKKQRERSDSKVRLSIGSGDVDAAFAAETGMPDFLINEKVEINLNEIQTWFGERIKGQDGAVNLVIDTIAAIKARLTRPGKPLASFLFIGPTGVGKTELGKTLAEFFYGSKDRLIRLDMSEYALPGSAGRLAAGGRSDEEGILTAQMRDQPFSVLLLDEFEKADASVYDLFLQVLGEARLTDGAGRLADFSNAIVILTSNLGAREFRLTRPGFHDSATDAGAVATEHFTEAVKKNFRPEFFNRIDRIVPFSPLSRDAVRAVVRREIGLAEYRDGLKNRNVSLMIPDLVISRLAEIGYDPRYGARPVKRAIEQWLLGPVADFLCNQEDAEEKIENGFLEITGISDGDAPNFEFKKANDESTDENREKADWFGKIPRLRRDFQRLASSSLVSEMQSERNRIRNRMDSASRIDHASDDHQRLADLNELLEKIAGDQTRILAAEEKLLLARFHEEPPTTFEAAMADAPEDRDFAEGLLNALAHVRNVPKRIVVVVKGDDWGALAKLVTSYSEVAREFGCAVRLGHWEKKPDKEYIHPEDLPQSGKPPVDVMRSIPVIPATQTESENLLAVAPRGLAAYAIEISGEHAAMRFSREVGLHVFLDEEGNRSRVAVGFFDEGEGLSEAWLPEAMMLDQDLTHLVVRRTWDRQGRRLRDSRLGGSPGTQELRLPWEFSLKNLAYLIDTTLVLEAKSFL